MLMNLQNNALYGEEAAFGSLLPKKLQILSGSALKLLAVITMLIDHVAAFLLSGTNIVLFELLGRSVDLYTLMRYVGRISFPIFAFLLVEGYLHTSDKKRYGANLLTFALISELPWNLVHSGRLFYGSQNIFFTLFLGVLAIWAFESFRGKHQIMMLLAVMLCALGLGADYGFRGVGFVLMLYVLRQQRLLRAVLGTCTLSGGWMAGLAFLPIEMYNQKRGFIRGKVWKYAFYTIYPVHLFLLYLIRLYLANGG